MVTLDWLHLVLGLLLLLAILWHVISTAGAQMRIAQLQYNNTVLNAIVRGNIVQVPVENPNEQPDSAES